MAIEKSISTGKLAMICDCGRSGPDWDAADLPIVPLKCDGRCTIVQTNSDGVKIARYKQYIKDGGKAWNRGCGGGWEPPEIGETPVSEVPLENEEKIS